MAVSLGLHGVWVAFLGMGAWRIFGDFPPNPAQSAAAERLDIVATALSILGVVVAVAAIGGFWAVRREAISAAENEAKLEVGKQMVLHVTEYLEKTNPELLQKLVIVAVQANPYLIKQAIGSDVNVADANAYSDALPPRDPAA